MAFVTAAAASANASLFLSANPANIAFPGLGTFCVAPDASLAIVSHAIGANGRGQLDVAIPADPALVGSSAHAQDLVVDGSAPNGMFALSNRASIALSASRQVFADDFEAYALGVPPAGGWQQFWGGPQLIVSPGHASRQAMQLNGAYCWSAVAYRPITGLVGKVRLEFAARVAFLSPPGCGIDMAFFGFWSPPGTACGCGSCTWGCGHHYLHFTSHGGILVAGRTIGSVRTSHWYRMAIQADLAAGVYVVEIDGQVHGPFAGSAFSPHGIAFYAGHGSGPNPQLLIDDVKVFTQ